MTGCLREFVHLQVGGNQYGQIETSSDLSVMSLCMLVINQASLLYVGAYHLSICDTCLDEVWAILDSVCVCVCLCACRKVTPLLTQNPLLFLLVCVSVCDLHVSQNSARRSRQDRSGPPRIGRRNGVRLAWQSLQTDSGQPTYHWHCYVWIMHTHPLSPPLYFLCLKLSQ